MRPSSTQKRIHTVAPTSQKFFVGSSNKKAKLIVLQVNGLHDETSKKLCGDYLLTVSTYHYGSICIFYEIWKIFLQEEILGKVYIIWYVNCIGKIILNHFSFRSKKLNQLFFCFLICLLLL